MKVKERVFKIEDIDCEVTVEVVNRQKDIFDYLDDAIENTDEYGYDGFGDDTYHIIYADGTEVIVDGYSERSKIKRKGIIAMCFNNDCTAVVYGNFSINEYGVVSASAEIDISDYNIKEVC